MRDNPAQRLHDVLAAMAARPGQSSVGSALAHVVGLPEDDLSNLLHAAAEVAGLPRLIVRDLGRLPADDIDPELHMEWADKVGSALVALTTLAHPLEGFTRQYTEATLVSLRHASHALRKLGRDVPDEDLDDLRAAVASIRAAVADDGGIDPELRRFLLARAAEMDRAITLFRVTGGEGIQQAVERAIGAEVVQRVSGKPAPDRDTDAGRSYYEMLNKASTFASLANNVLGLASKIGNALGMGA